MRQKIKKDLRKESHYITLETTTGFAHISSLTIPGHEIGNNAYFSLIISRGICIATLSENFSFKLQNAPIVFLELAIKDWNKERRTV